MTGLRRHHRHYYVPALITALALGCCLALAICAPPAWAAAQTGNSLVDAAGETTARFQIELGQHAAPIRGLSLTADGLHAITVSGDKSARVWRLSDQSIRQVFRPADGGGRNGTLYAVAAHPVDDLAAVAGLVGDARSSNRILMFSPGDARFIRAIDAGAGEITQLQWTVDGRLLLATYRDGNGLRAFDALGNKVFEQSYDGSSYGLAVHQNGSILATSYEGYIHQFSYADGQIRQIRQIKAHHPAPRGVAFSRDGTRFAVGYRGKAGAQGAPTIHLTGSGKLEIALPRPEVSAGNLATVFFETDNTLLAAGSAYTEVARHRVYRYNTDSGRILRESFVAGNTITALAGTSTQHVLFAAFDGTWGMLDEQLAPSLGSAPLADFRGPANLRISDDGRRIGLNYRYGTTPLWFDFDRRLVTPGALPTDLIEPQTRRGLFSRDNWENTRQPEVFGQTVSIAADEVSRSIAYTGDRRLAILGTSRQLKAINSDGQVLWSSQTPAEVWSVNIVSALSVAVAALADGTIRWWDLKNGTLLTSLLMLPDRRWLLWTPDGYFDASAGADRLAGWAINRADQPVADFVSLNRFRDRYRRFELINAILSVNRGGVSAQPAPGNQAARAPASMFLPPIVRNHGNPRLDTGSGQLLLPFLIESTSKSLSVEVRINGRPVEPLAIDLARESVSRSVGQIALAAPPSNSVVQIIARTESGISEPLSVRSVQPEATPRPTPDSFEQIPNLPESLKAAEGFSQPAVKQPSPEQAISPDAGVQTLYALAIGISDYQRPSYRLRLAAKDASDMTAALTAASGTAYDVVKTRLLTDRDATAEQIRHGLKWLQQSVKANDLGILFIAGHGLNDDNGEYFFLPWEGQHEALKATGIAESALRNTLGGMRGRALLFIDTCYAGGAIGTFRSASRELAALANNLAASENGVIVFASSTGEQLSEENDAWGNGAFTKAVIEGLSGKADFNRNGRITYKALDFYVSDVVTKLTDGRQTPVTLSPVGVPDFSIVSRGPI